MVCWRLPFPKIASGGPRKSRGLPHVRPEAASAHHVAWWRGGVAGYGAGATADDAGDRVPQRPVSAKGVVPAGVTRHAIASARHDQLRDVTGLSIRWEKVSWGTERSQAAVRTAAPRCRVKSVITDSFARFTARMSGGSQRVPTGIVACAPRHPRRLDAPGVPAEMSSIP